MAGRPPRKPILTQSQLRFASSGPHSPPRRGTRGRRCDMPLHPIDENLSLGAPAALRKKRAMPELVSASQTSPSLGYPSLIAGSGCPYRIGTRTHVPVRSCEPSYHSKKMGLRSMDSTPRMTPPRSFPVYSTDCSFQTPFTSEKSASRGLLSWLPGSWARSCSGAGSPVRFSSSENCTDFPPPAWSWT